MEWINIKDAIEIYKKSDSFFRRLKQELIKSKSKYIKSEKGKIYFERGYLDKKFDKVVNSQKVNSEKSNEQDSASVDKDKLIDFLTSQLNEKDKQINELIERNRETNILMSQLQNRILIESPEQKKKRWFW
jgi:hypothetical protein